MPAADWREGIRSLLDRVTPFHLDWIQVEVSSLCQGECLYCPVSLSSRERKGALMSMETFQRLEPWFPSADLVFLQGWGEPLLNPEFWEMARRVRAAGSRVGFTTSGVPLDRGNRQALLASGLDTVGVSLAGSSPGIHDRYRPGCPLEVVDGNLRLLRREGNASAENGPTLHLAYLLMAGNLQDLPHAVDLAEGWGAQAIVVSHLSPVLKAGLQEEALLAHPDRWPRVQAVLDETRVRAEARGIGFHAYGPGADGGPHPTCTENILGSCFVSARGDVSPCVSTNLGLDSHTGSGAIHWFRGHRAPLATLTFGNLNHASLKEIWHSDTAQRFRAVFRERLTRDARAVEDLPDPCRHCYKLFQS
jgi:MoaA/NifB/PqqE/SkfB family radical SAM enzyme